MSGSSKWPLYDNPNAPKISSQDYFNEKADFAGLITCAILYGTYFDFRIHLSLPTRLSDLLF